MDAAVGGHDHLIAKWVDGRVGQRLEPPPLGRLAGVAQCGDRLRAAVAGFVNGLEIEGVDAAAVVDAHDRRAVVRARPFQRFDHRCAAAIGQVIDGVATVNGMKCAVGGQGGGAVGDCVNARRAVKALCKPRAGEGIGGLSRAGHDQSGQGQRRQNKQRAYQAEHFRVPPFESVARSVNRG